MIFIPFLIFFLPNLCSSAEFDNETLWSELWRDCKTRTSFDCVKSGMFRYLDRNLEIPGDLDVTETVAFLRNRNKYEGVCENSEEARMRCDRYYEERLNIQDVSENEIVPKKVSVDDNDVLEGDNKNLHGMEDISDILYDKGKQFLMTHDLELGLPGYLGGGSIRLEPKKYIEETDEEEEGALVKIVFKPPKSKSSESGRFLFQQLKKLFKKKLMHSFMALLLVVKLIKVKLMFLLPMIVGQATAKKLLLKVLLFLIPGLAHLFKLCHYYHMEHAKYHHHHHKIKHHHHHVQVPVPVPVPVPVHQHHHPDEPHVHHHVEPTLHHVHDHDYPPYPPAGVPSHLHGSTTDDDYESGGGWGSNGPEYNRNEYPASPSLATYNDNEAALTSWGLGANSNYHETGVLDAKDQPVYYGQETKNLYKKSPAIGSYLNQPQHQVFTPRPSDGVYDPFYSPILQKIDTIFVQLGFNEEPCRERLVCSMYKTPHRFSPHSNLISNEISRDSKELQRPTVNNPAVLRFYRYVQAARDGQEQRDCLRLYPACAINTEK